MLCIFPCYKEKHCAVDGQHRHSKGVTVSTNRCILTFVPHLYLVLWPCPQETLQAAQLDQELHTHEAWQL